MPLGPFGFKLQGFGKIDSQHEYNWLHTLPEGVGDGNVARVTDKHVGAGRSNRYYHYRATHLNVQQDPVTMFWDWLVRACYHRIPVHLGFWNVEHVFYDLHDCKISAIYYTARRFNMKWYKYFSRPAQPSEGVYFALHHRLLERRLVLTRVAGNQINRSL